MHPPSRLVKTTGVAMALALAGCGASTTAASPPSGSSSFTPLPGNQQVAISLESYILAEGAAPTSALRGMIGDFERIHPNIHVTARAPSGGISNASSIVGSLQRDEAAGNAPDVEQGTFDGLSYLATGLGAVDLTKRIGPAAIAANYGGDHPYATAVTRLGMVGGETYGVPWTLSTPILFYNADLFSGAGLDPKHPPTTWQEVQQDAVAIKKATGMGGIANGCVGSASLGSDWCLQAIVDSAGGHVLSSTSGGKVTLDSAGNVKALSVLQGVADAGAMPNLSSSQATEEFGTGQVAMLLQSSAIQGQLLKTSAGHFTVDAAEMPGFGTTAPVPTSSGSGLFILSKDPVRQRAAWELIQYLTGDRAETTITENIGYPPLRPTLVDDARYLQSWSGTQPLLTPNLAQLSHISPWRAYPGPNFSQIETLFLNDASKVVFENANPAQTMGQAQSQASGLVGPA